MVIGSQDTGFTPTSYERHTCFVAFIMDDGVIKLMSLQLVPAHSIPSVNVSKMLSWNAGWTLWPFMALWMRAQYGWTCNKTGLVLLRSVGIQTLLEIALANSKQAHFREL